MKSIVCLVILLTMNGLSKAFPTPSEHDPEQGDYFEGDIVLSPEQAMNLAGVARNGIIAEKYRWPNRIVYYKFAKGHFDAAHKSHILRGMQQLEEVSCIRFAPADETTTAFIIITGLPTGCYSSVGFQNKQQVVNFKNKELDKGCFRLGSIVHEFLHALGFYHQQSASNRDDYVKIVKDNISEGKEHNFEIHDTTDFGIEYDYGSVMHYDSTAFSKNGEKTIIPIRDETAKIGQRRGLSSKDIYKLNMMYECETQTK